MSAVTGPARIIEAAAPGEYRLIGPLTFETVTGIWREGTALMANAQRISVDLAEVSRTDSAGLALLVEWRRLARKLNAPIEFRNLPVQMTAIAVACHLDALLGSTG